MYVHPVFHLGETIGGGVDEPAKNLFEEKHSWSAPIMGCAESGNGFEASLRMR